jgi:hypothetical protein
MGLTTILTTIWVGGLGTSLDALPMSGGQGVASSNLASPTRKRHAAEARESLRVPLALAIGPDPVTMLKDVAGLDAERTRRALKCAAHAILRAAVPFEGRSERESPQAG